MARPLSRYEAQELADWVERGGVLFVGGARHYVPGVLGVAFDDDPACKEKLGVGLFGDDDTDTESGEDGAPPVELEPADAGQLGDAGVDVEGAADAGAADAGVAAVAGAAPGGGASDWEWAIADDAALEGLDMIPMHRAGRLAVAADADARALLLSTGPGAREAGVLVRHGRGRVIALASASMLQNQMLATSGGGVLFARLMKAYGGRGPVLFDEYHLGVGERRSLMRYLRQAGAMPYLMQLLLVAALALWRGGARFGGVREPEPSAPASTASFVAALGALFTRAGDAASALRLLARQALQRVAAHHHLPPMSADKLARALAAGGRDDAAAAVLRIAALEAEDARAPGRLAALSRELDEQVARACRL
jgi:hypothetical protein